jgi:uncharacterized protein YcfL
MQKWIFLVLCSLILVMQGCEGTQHIETTNDETGDFGDMMGDGD